MHRLAEGCLPNRSCTPTEVHEAPALPSVSSCGGSYQQQRGLVMWASLFPEYVCGYLDPQDVVRLGQASRRLAAVVHQPHVWRAMLQSHFCFSAADCQLLDRVMLSDVTVSQWPAAGRACPSERGSSPIGPPTVHLKKSGCIIDHLMLAPDMPRLARVVRQIATPSGASTVESRTKQLPSPIRPSSRDAGTCSYGTTPTPQRHHREHNRSHPLLATTAAASTWSSTTSPAEFNIRATVQQLVASHLAPTPLLRTATAASSELAVQWVEIEQRPAAFTFDDAGAGDHGVSSSRFVSHTERAALSPAVNPLEPLLYATATMSLPDGQGDDDGTPLLTHDERRSSSSSGAYFYHDTEGYHNPLEPMEYGTVAEDDDYSSGALFLGGGQHQRLAELWERRDSGTPATETTLLHINSMQRAWDEGTYRSGSLASCYYAAENQTVPATPLGSSATAQLQMHNQPFATSAAASPSAIVVASTCCAETLAASLRYQHASYPLQKLYAFVFTHRVRNFVGTIAARRLEACKAITYNRDAEALELLTLSIQNTMEGGCGRSNLIREALVSDLVLRGRVLRSQQRDDDAIGDFALAHLLDPTCTEAYAEASVITTAAQRCSVNASRILSPNFVLEHAYEQLLQDGSSLTSRAAFLYEVCFWRGPTLMLYVYQYLLCDVIRVWPVRLLLAAEELAQTPSERLMVRAWILLDSGDGDKAAATAELAVSLLPPEVTRAVDDTERVCTQAARRLMLLGNHHGEDASGISDAAAGQSHSIFCEQLRRVQDVNIQAVVIAAQPYGSHERCGTDVGPYSDVFNALRQHFSSPSTISPCASFTFFTLAFMAGGTDVSVEAYRRHIFSRPCASRIGTALNNLGQLLSKRQEAPAATLVLLEAAEHAYPVHNGTLRSLARCYAQLGRMREAYDAVSKLADTPTFTGRRADALFERARMTTAPMADLLRATELDPRCSQPYRLRAAMAMDRGDIQEALREMTTLIELTLEASDVALRALFRRDSGDRRGAIHDMALACTLMPSRKDYRTTLDELVAEEAHTAWLGANHFRLPRDTTASDTEDDLRIAGLPLASVFRAAAGWGAIPTVASLAQDPVPSAAVVVRNDDGAREPPNPASVGRRLLSTSTSSAAEQSDDDGGEDNPVPLMTPVPPPNVVEESAKAMLGIARWL